MLNLRDGSEEWRWWTFFPDWRDPLADEPDYSYEPLEERSEGVELSSLPAEVTAAVGGGETVADRWVFLLVKCGRTKDLYLVRYRKEIEKRDCFGSGRSIYNVAAADPLDDFDVDGEGMKITVSTEQLHGILPCPHCKNAAWGRCHCSRLFSMPLQAGKLTRPWCGKADDYGDNGSGDVSGGGERDRANAHAPHSRLLPRGFLQLGESPMHASDPVFPFGAKGNPAALECACILIIAFVAREPLI